MNKNFCSKCGLKLSTQDIYCSNCGYKLNVDLSTKIRGKLNFFLQKKPIYIDTETTGVGYEDEIIDIAIIDFDGAILLDSLVKPTVKIPYEASNIHGISNDMVTNAPKWDELWPKINKIFQDRIIGIYNAEFDIRLMQQTQKKYGVWSQSYREHFCIMLLFADYFGDWDDYHQNNKWKKLGFAGNHFNINIKNTHRALDDAKLSRLVAISMRADFDKKLISPKISHEINYQERRYIFEKVQMGGDEYDGFLHKKRFQDPILEEKIQNIENIKLNNSLILEDSSGKYHNKDNLRMDKDERFLFNFNSDNNSSPSDWIESPDSHVFLLKFPAAFFVTDITILNFCIADFCKDNFEYVFHNSWIDDKVGVAAKEVRLISRVDFKPDDSLKISLESLKRVLEKSDEKLREKHYPIIDVFEKIHPIFINYQEYYWDTWEKHRKDKGVFGAFDEIQKFKTYLEINDKYIFDEYVNQASKTSHIISYINKDKFSSIEIGISYLVGYLERNSFNELLKTPSKYFSMVMANNFIKKLEEEGFEIRKLFSNSENDRKKFYRIYNAGIKIELKNQVEDLVKILNYKKQV
jgi:DNA polymerase III subunit epsilon